MKRNDGAKKISLTMVQKIAVADWFRKLLPEFQAERPTTRQVAAKVSEDLGFTVTRSHILEMRRNFGTWKSKTDRIYGGVDRVRVLAGIVVRAFEALGYEPLDDDREALRAIVRAQGQPNKKRGIAMPAEKGEAPVVQPPASANGAAGQLSDRARDSLRRL